ncbi:hypothetical protein R3W88_019509 [Solanum pinnatisectum]|uniref:Uncharacterized protein n=1 Tax=Solanum pinnatisectum TaxID=50273 RepID=A0AAV9KJQ3_9SOLN|nr:hypothetical protein R3W88_019509 [Solanum pinnatisectum]
MSYINMIANKVKQSETIQQKEGKAVEKGKDIHIEKEDKKLENEANSNISERPWIHYFQKGKARVLSSGKVIGNPGSWSGFMECGERQQICIVGR